MATAPVVPSTLRCLFADTVRKHPERPAITYRLPNAGAPISGRQSRQDAQAWRTLTWHELAYLVLDIAAALEVLSARTVAILCDTDARYLLIELGVALTGRVLQPLYTSSTDEEIRDAIAISGAGVLIVGASQANRARTGALHSTIVELAVVARLPGVDARPYEALPPDVEPFDTQAALARLARLPPRALRAPLLYLQSTGTTGPARVIEVSEVALVTAIEALRNEASHQFPRLLSFLPTAHISERLLTLYLSTALAGHTWYGGGLDTLGEDLRSCRPTIVLAPPMLLEIIRAQALAEAGTTALGRHLSLAVQKTADAMLSAEVVGRCRRPLTARLFGSRLRRSAGLDQVRDALTGTAPVSPALHAWYEAAGIPLRIVYGQTELPGATSITSRTGATFGSVGLSVNGVETTISNSGELLVRTQSAFTRYVGDPSATARVTTVGWFHTGDRAKVLASGEIALLGRVQSLLMAPDGFVVDTTRIAVEVRASLGDADVVFADAEGTAGAFLYVAIRTPAPMMAACPVPDTDVRWERLAGAIETADPHAVVRGWALFEGAFPQVTGEVGPTGKARGWRINTLRSQHLRPRFATPAPTNRQMARSIFPRAG